MILLVDTQFRLRQLSYMGLDR